jgi:hypothetical protein
MKTSKKQRLCVGVGLWICVLLARPCAASSTNAILRWNEDAGRAAIAACLAPGGNALAESRMYAMTHLAIHDAVNAIERRSRPYAFDAHVNERTSRNAAIAAAARDVMVAVIGELQESTTCIQNGIASVEADYAGERAAIPDTEAKAKGIELGRRYAA